jgi:hypothetical protein
MKLINIAPILFLIILVYVVCSCSRQNEVISRNATYEQIDNFSKQTESDTVKTFDWKLYEDVSSDSIFLYYFDDATKIGWVLVKTPFQKRQPNRIFHHLEDKTYEVLNSRITISAFIHLGDSSSSDADDIIFYNERFGLVAIYSLNWDNLMLLTNLNGKNLDQEYSEFMSSLLGDSDFFPIPSKAKILIE